MPPTDTAKTYRRRIRLESSPPCIAFGALEDPAHHVRVTVRFDGDTVESVTGEAVRLPWLTCPGAVAGLTSLGGMTLTTSLRRLRNLYDPTSHCTHLFDLAQLTLADAASGRRQRGYEVIIPTGQDVTTASLLRDGHTFLEWTVERGTIVGPDPFSGVGLREGFLGWCEQHLDEDTAEGAFVLRRAVSMAGIANMRMDDYAVVADSGLPPASVSPPSRSASGSASAM